MSQLGQFQTLSRVLARSVRLSTTDMGRRHWHVRFVPEADIGHPTCLMEMIVHPEFQQLNILIDGNRLFRNSGTYA